MGAPAAAGAREAPQPEEATRREYGRDLFAFSEFVRGDQPEAPGPAELLLQACYAANKNRLGDHSRQHTKFEHTNQQINNSTKQKKTMFST